MNIVAIGTGYVGLVTGVCYASLGHSVVCLDIDAAKIAGLQGGQLPIYEPGLDGLVQEAVAAGRLRFTTDYDDALDGAELALIAVGTPTEADSNRANTKFVDAAFDAILAARRSGPLSVVVKSTVPGRDQRPAAGAAGRQRREHRHGQHSSGLKPGIPARRRGHR